MSKIILTTLNARYTHTSLALRYIFANMRELQSDTKILEFVINESNQDIAEQILSENPEIIGFGVYIWNALDVAEVVSIIKSVRADIKIILGGPEVSYEPLRVDFCFDYIICGEGDVSFYQTVKAIFDGKTLPKVIKSEVVNLNSIELPYKFYSNEDIKNRYIYVEASRGCPFLCQFCLSSLDERVRYFDIDKLLIEFEILWSRGVRNFKFIDRTFNLNMKVANRLIDFFLSKNEDYFLHFEVIPNSFPERLKDKLKLFKEASLQLEVGIQTLNEDVAEKIERKIDINKIRSNLAFLEKDTKAHLHVDLIVGLPSETIESFGKNLNELYKLSNSEIQIGILKKLSGTKISIHDEEFKMVYSKKPPYDILQNSLISFEEMQKLKRFARFWDLVYNRGNFNQSVKLIFINGDVFGGFYKFSEWIYKSTKSTWQISLERLAQLLFKYLIEELNYESDVVAKSLIDDIMKIDGRVVPGFLKEYGSNHLGMNRVELSKMNKRQLKHLK